MKTFEGKEKLTEIIVELDKWNRNYNQSKEYLAIACVDGNWHCDNAECFNSKEIDLFISKKTIEKIIKDKEECGK